MGKRKRNENQNSHSANGSNPKTASDTQALDAAESDHDRMLQEARDGPHLRSVQIILGTYEKVLHGITATFLEENTPADVVKEKVEFADTFLIGAHGSSIRTLALSPPPSEDMAQKILLASGGSDQVINLYQLSAQAPPPSKEKVSTVPSLTGKKVSPNPGNRELGSLQNHAGGVNALYFPTRTKLISAAEDCTIAVTRTRDWTMLSTIKAPIPKAHGRPSGDTAPLGGTPAGINDFAIHPSMKLMVSVSKGERCMRLWNLVTGKRAGVLNFEKRVLQNIGEGKWASGEGRKVRWNSLGEQFVIGFERGCAIFGLESKVKSILSPVPPSKIHQIRYVSLEQDLNDSQEILAVSTEDGRILFFNAHQIDDQPTSNDIEASIPTHRPFAQLGGVNEGLIGRIKDFEILGLPGTDHLLAITGSSDGAVRLWKLSISDLSRCTSGNGDFQASKISPRAADDVRPADSNIPQVGQLLGSYEAGNRITCLAAFVMKSQA